MAFGIGSILSTVKDIVGIASAVSAVAAPFLAQEQAKAPAIPEGPDLIQEQKVASAEAREKKQRILKRKKAGRTVFTDPMSLGSSIDDATKGFGALGAR